MNKDKKRAKLVAKLEDADKAFRNAVKARWNAEIALRNYDKSKDL